MNVTPWTAPEAFERPIFDLTDRAEEAGLAVLIPELEEDYGAGFRSTAAMSAAVAAILTNAEIRRVWARAGRRSTEAAGRHWVDEVRRAGIEDDVTDPDLPRRELERWQREQVERFELLRNRVKAETEQRMRQDRDSGMSPAVAAAGILALGLPTRNGRLRGRGRVIAADQLATLGGLIARRQQRDAGLREFIWQTREDSVVRDTHASLNKRRFRWSEPPDIGYPGEPINCRCVAIGVVRE